MPKSCAKCGLNGGTKRWCFIHHNTFKAFLCAPCIESLGGSKLALEWLEGKPVKYAFQMGVLHA